MKFVLMHFMRTGSMTSVTVAGVPQMPTDNEMLEYVSEKQLFGEYLRLFERPDHFEVVERSCPSPYNSNCVVRVTSVDMLKEYDIFYNKVAKRRCEAKQMLSKFEILNMEGNERSGDPKDWLVNDSGSLRVCTSDVFKGNYIKLPILKQLNCARVIDELETDCIAYTLERGDVCVYCAVCGELVQAGWICQHDAYHVGCVVWKSKV